MLAADEDVIAGSSGLASACLIFLLVFIFIVIIFFVPWTPAAGLHISNMLTLLILWPDYQPSPFIISPFLWP